jgi:hypothetical protein
MDVVAFKTSEAAAAAARLRVLMQKASEGGKVDAQAAADALVLQARVKGMLDDAGTSVGKANDANPEAVAKYGVKIAYEKASHEADALAADAQRGLLEAIAGNKPISHEMYATVNAHLPAYFSALDALRTNGNDA